MRRARLLLVVGAVAVGIIQLLRYGRGAAADGALRQRLRALHRSNAALAALLRRLDAQLEDAYAALPEPQRTGAPGAHYELLHWRMHLMRTAEALRPRRSSCRGCVSDAKLARGRAELARRSTAPPLLERGGGRVMPAAARDAGRGGGGERGARAAGAATRALGRGAAGLPGRRKAEYPAGTAGGPCVGPPVDVAGALAAVVTVTYNRADYLDRHMASLLDVHGRERRNRRRFPLFVSQDGAPPHRTTRDVARSHPAQITYLSHQQRGASMVSDSRENAAYYRIAEHYRFVLGTLFDCFKYPRVIILEDDMELAPDFFGYFAAAAPLLDADASLLCASSWNDHGQARLVRDAARLERTDFFPGLGWMLTAALWGELRDKWPKGYWDDWLRLAHVRRGRQCIRPEVCRTYNYGEQGSSRGQFYRRYLQPIRLNDEDIAWEGADLSYLDKRRYEADFALALGAARVVRSARAAKAAVGDVLLAYSGKAEYERITSSFGMLSDWKDGIPRASYRGVVTVHWEQARVFIAPSQARGGAADDDGAEPEPRREAGAGAGARAERLRWATPEETEEMWGDEDDWESY